MPIVLNNFPEYRPYTNIQPFTVRDGATYLLQLEALKDWIRDYVIPSVNGEIGELAEDWKNLTTLILADFDAKTGALEQLVTDAVDGIGDSVAMAESAQLAAEAARDLAEQFASQAEAMQDASIADIAGNEASNTRILFDSIYAKASELSALASEISGRLSEASLDAAYADKVTQAYVEDNLQPDDLDLFIGERVNRKNTIVIDASTFGDFVSDPAASINAAIASVPGNSSFAGAEIFIPQGQWTIKSTILVNKPGVVLRGAGGFSTRLIADATLTGSLIEYSITNTFVRGAQIENLRISLDAGTANGVTVKGGYDNCSISNLFVEGVGNGAYGIGFIPAEGAPSNVSQTLEAGNCYVICKAGATGTAWKLVRLQEATFVGCKGKGGGEGIGTAWELDSVRGLTFIGCSAALADIGFSIVANIASVDTVVINSVTVEGVSRTIVSSAAAGNSIIRLNVSNVRPQIASTIGAGPITIANGNLCDLDIGNILTVLEATTQATVVKALDPARVTNSGTRNNVIIREGAVHRNQHRSQTGFEWYLGTNEVARLVNAGTNETGIMLAVNRGGTVTVSRVTIGAPDSGGTGFRQLLVAN